MRLILAPMEGLADSVLRNILTHIGGFDECVTEFMRITHTVHGKTAWLKHVAELRHHNGCCTTAGTPCTVQLLGSDADNMAINALNAVALGAQKIDLNFGCPAPTVNKHRGGSILLNEPETVYHIVATLRQALPPHIPLTAKMRLGYEDTARTFENAQAIEAGGACGLTVHARTKVEGYRPPAHWHWFTLIQEKISIPLTANGDVFTLQDYLALKAESHCESIMLGRGAVMRPDLARQIKYYEQGLPPDEMTFIDIVPWVARFVAECAAFSPNNKYPIARVKQWLSMMRKVYSEAGALFDVVRPIQQVDELQTAIHHFMHTNEAV